MVQTFLEDTGIHIVAHLVKIIDQEHNISINLCWKQRAVTEVESSAKSQIVLL